MHTAVSVDPEDYALIIEELRKHQGNVSLALRKQLAAKAMMFSADYETLLAQEFSKRLLGDNACHQPRLAEGRRLRYGENPDQEAWIYTFQEGEGIAQSKILSGKELSYNNYEDATVAYHAAQELLSFGVEFGAAVIKHGGLCGYATGPSSVEAFQRAWDGDSKSAFGGVIAFTFPANGKLIPLLKNKFVEVLIAPEFSKEFVDWAADSKPNLRLLSTQNASAAPYIYKSISGGMLVQTRKERLAATLLHIFNPCDPAAKQKTGVVTKRLPEESQRGLFAFSIAAVNYAKSNAAAIAREYLPGYYQLIGIGAGQPNRIDCVKRLAIPKALETLQSEHQDDPSYDAKNDLKKCVLASDGFFPFDDSIRYAGEQGIDFCIQPGGSAQDPQVIRAADELDICMVFTGARYFYH